METAEKSEVSKKESLSYDSKKDTSKRPELKSSVMAKKVERKLYPEPQVERKVSVVEVKAPVVVEVIKEEEEEVEVAELGTEGAAVEETENSGSGSSKVSFSTSKFKTTHLDTMQENKAPLKKSAKAEKPTGDVSPHIPLSAMAGYDFPFLNHFLGGGKKKEAIPEPPKSKPPR